MKRRISNPRAITVVALAAIVAAAVAVTPTVAKKTQSFLTTKRAEATYVSNKKASTLYLKKKAATNLFVAKASAPKAPAVGIAAGTAPFSASATTAGYVPSAFTSFATKAEASSAVITFSGNVSCTAAKPTAALACPIQILVDGQSQGKVNIAPAVAGSPAPALLAASVTTTTVLGKGGHTVAVQYAGAKDVTFNLKGWNLAVAAYPQPDEELVTAETGGKKGS
ncbi:MAG TPA: hypothetical protein VFY48_05085 [Solirubrobacterales bacterium]|nr:hypothetical protein [Solirubrobacterales bacterium]